MSVKLLHGLNEEQKKEFDFFYSEYHFPLGKIEGPLIAASISKPGQVISMLEAHVKEYPNPPRSNLIRSLVLTSRSKEFTEKVLRVPGWSFYHESANARHYFGYDYASQRNPQTIVDLIEVLKSMDKPYQEIIDGILEYLVNRYRFKATSHPFYVAVKAAGYFPTKLADIFYEIRNGNTEAHQNNTKMVVQMMIDFPVAPWDTKIFKKLSSLQAPEEWVKTNFMND